jgi:hypothetical protein
VLPTNDAMVRQIVGLERRNSYGPEKIDHRPGARDDVANCIAGLAELCRDYNQHPQPAFGRWGSHADAGESPLWYTPPHLRKPSPSRFDGPVPELGKNAFASSVGGTFERQPGAYKQARKTTKGSKWE